MTAADLTERFLAFSADVTAFTEFDLLGTGQAGTYLETVVRVVGEDVLTELLDAYDQATRTAGEDAPASTDGQQRQAWARALDRDVFSDPKLGAVARNIIKLWYVGVWYALPAEWTQDFGARADDGTFTASPQAYPVGLLWQAIGANPPGARAPGYASWALPPAIPPIPGAEPVTVGVPRPRGAGERLTAQEERAKEAAQ